jgi:cytochrome c
MDHDAMGSMNGMNSMDGMSNMAGTAGDPVEGQKLFARNCMQCHGRNGKGTDQGPPLVHKIYEPSHHNDMSFHRAAMQGVRAHHWQFGNMPKIEGMTEEHMTHIIAYVRKEQRKAGIF